MRRGLGPPGPLSSLWHDRPRRGWHLRLPRRAGRMTERVRIRKLGTRDGRPTMLEDGHVVEGDELAAPTPGQPYSIRRTVVEHAEAPEVFATSPVRAVITEKDGSIVVLTDNSRYRVEIVGR
jgi:hypothetical protein